MAVRHIPAGFHSLVPATIVKGADKAIDFYKKVFNAEEKARYADPSGIVRHAELKLGDSVLMLGEAVDVPLADQFYGDRSGTVLDPFGNEWTIGTHKEDVSEEEMQRRMKSMPH